MNGPPPLTVELGHREVMAASAELQRGGAASTTLYTFAMVIMFLLAMRVGLSLAFMISQNLDPSAMILIHPLLNLAIPAVLFLLGLRAVNGWYNREAARRYARMIRTRNIPDTVPATYTIEPDGVRLSTTRGEWLARWVSTYSLEPGLDGWVIGNDLGSLFIPCRAFADKDQERAWVTTLLEHMEEPARSASKAAQDYVTQQS